MPAPSGLRAEAFFVNTPAVKFSRCTSGKFHYTSYPKHGFTPYVVLFRGAPLSEHGAARISGIGKELCAVQSGENRRTGCNREKRYSQ
jgi:hypothetical protein